MSTANGTRCCAKCSTPFGHSAVAGQCCHPTDRDRQARELANLERAIFGEDER